MKLQSSDGKVFEVDADIGKMMLKNLGIDDDIQEVVPLPNVNASILKKVMMQFL